MAWGLNARAAILAWVFVSALCGVGCGSDDDGKAAGSGASANGGATGGGATGGSATGGAAGDGDSGSGGGSTGGQDNGSPVLCGGAYSKECGEGYFCRFQTGCGTVGHCTRMPKNCDDAYEPVCGCDGNTYGNECQARLAGVSVRDTGECDEAEQFPCGPYQCARTSYCLDKNGTDSSTIWQHACISSPTECGDTPSCACLTDPAGCIVGHTCEEADGVTVTCK